MAFLGQGVGCRAPVTGGQLYVFDTSSGMTDALPRSAGKELEPRVSTVRLVGAMNETLGFSFAFQPPAQIPAGRLTIVPSALHQTTGQGVIEAMSVTLFRMHPVRLSSFPGWHVRSIPPNQRNYEPLDALVPLRAPRGGLPASAQPGETYAFWADLHIPKETADGTYQGTIEWRVNDRAVASLGLELAVLPILLPDGGEVPILAGLDHGSLFAHHVRVQGRPFVPYSGDWATDPQRDELDGLLNATLRTLHAHRVTPLPLSLAPRTRVNAHRRVETDWEEYDRIALSWVGGRFSLDREPLPAWPIPMADRHLTGGGGPAPSDDPELLREYLKQCAAHFAREGLLEQAFFDVGGLGSTGDLQTRAALSTAAAAQAADRRLRLLTSSPPQNLSEWGWSEYAFPSDLAERISLWAPPGRFYDPALMNMEREKGRHSWLTVDRPPFTGSVSVHAPAGCILSLPWVASRLGAEALRLGTINHWPDAATAPDPTACAAIDADVLLYPGAAFGLDEPVPTLRLKLLRRAQQDAAYRRMLEESGLGHVSTALTQSMVPYAGMDAIRTHFSDGRAIGFAGDAAPYDLARQAMIDILLSRDAAAADAVPTDVFSRTAAWRRLMLDTRRPRIDEEGCRVRLSDQDQAAVFAVECLATVTNLTRVPIDGTLSLTSSQPAVATADEPAAIQAIAPNSTRRAVVEATLHTLPTGTTGTIPISLALDAGAGRIEDRSGRIALIGATITKRAPRIDGDLSDWPPGRGNVAGNFRLITGDGGEQGGLNATHPRLPTFALVMRDDAAIYVAVNCESGGESEQSSVQSSVVEYDDMIPISGDLVELLFDPLNAGTRSPADLFRVAVKPSAAFLAEQGMRCHPPCGPRRLWPADIELAVRRGSKQWTVEVRIPLTAFGSTGQEHAVWGFNVTRFDARRQEFSTWSGAGPNAYDPASLGNLYLPPL